jgi:hypothetical protein
MKKIYVASIVIASVCLPAVVSAQGADPERAPGAASVATPANEPWTFMLGVSGNYEGNALFVGPSEGEELSHRVQGTISRSWLMPRGGANLNANASQPFYHESTSLNDFQYGVGGGISYAITRRLQWAASTTFTSGLARDSSVLNDAGQFLPSSDTARSSNASSMFSYALNPRSSLSWSLTESGVGFSSAFLSGGASVVSAITYTRQVGKSQTFGFTQDYQRSFAEGDASTIYGFLGNYSATAGKGWTFFASVGVRPYTTPRLDGFQMTTGISTGFTKPIRPGQTFGASYNRGVQQTFGLLPRVSVVDTVSGNYETRLARKLTAAFGGSYSRSGPTDQILFATSGEGAHGSLSYAVITNLSVAITTYYYGRTQEPLDRVTSFGTAIQVNYITSWR